ncbi:proteasome inhibitor PI31 subunit-like [Branchiostoma floridae x Branchiostoma japonicum]
MAVAAGLELLYSSVCEQVQSEHDALVCFLHWEMVQSGFKCVGKGDEAPVKASKAKKSELLPRGWNRTQDVYALRYQPSDTEENYLMKAIKMDDSLLVHVMRVKDEKVGSLTLNVKDYINKSDLQDFDSVYKNVESLEAAFQSGIVEEFKPQNRSSNAATNSEERKEDKPGRSQRAPRMADDPDHDPLRIGPPRRPRDPYRQGNPEWGEPSRPYPSVGTGDLDPFSGGIGGGMLVDPMRSGYPRGPLNPSAGIPGMVPRGSVPPGARFDPIGPVTGGAMRGPDPDHLPPPGFDDMFM